MPEEKQESIMNAHRYFSVECFNKAWDFIDKTERSIEETETMLHLSHVSFWHWTQVPDSTPANLSIGYWQLSRVYALAGKGDESLYYGNRSLHVAIENNLDPFTVGYAYEAIARAYRVLQNDPLAQENKVKALQYCDQISVQENKAILESDLKTI